jgi:hypothetical protein
MFNLIKAIFKTLFSKRIRPTMHFSQFIVLNKDSRAKMLLVDHVQNATK